VNEPGSFTWNELATKDLDASRDFYTTVFGWGVDAEASGDDGAAFTVDGNIVCGAHVAGEGEFPAWSVWFAVADCDATAAKVTELGGSVFMPPNDMSFGRGSVVADPHGAVFRRRRGEARDVRARRLTRVRSGGSGRLETRARMANDSSTSARSEFDAPTRTQASMPARIAPTAHAAMSRGRTSASEVVPSRSAINGSARAPGDLALGDTQPEARRRLHQLGALGIAVLGALVGVGELEHRGTQSGEGRLLLGPAAQRCLEGRELVVVVAE